MEAQIVKSSLLNIYSKESPAEIQVTILTPPPYDICHFSTNLTAILRYSFFLLSLNYKDYKATNCLTTKLKNYKTIQQTRSLL